MSNLTRRNDNRFVLFPIKHPNIWEMYKQAEAAFWTAEEINLRDDLKDWSKLSKDEKHFISYVLAFFAGSDGIVGENLALRFYNDVTIPEARAFYGFQLMMEGIHSETYSLLIDTYIKDEEEKSKLLNAISTIPIIKKKADWAIKWIESSDNFLKRLIAFAAVEGIFFSSSFASIYWLKKRGLMPGLSFSNDLISLDENSHADFACLLYSISDEKLSKEEIINIIDEAVKLEIEFCTEALPVKLLGINCDSMAQYVKFVADGLLQKLSCNKIYNVENPFDFMELITVRPKSNFFEVQSNQYARAATGKKSEENKITFDADF